MYDGLHYFRAHKAESAVNVLYSLDVNFMIFLIYIIHYHIILKIYEYYMFVKIDFEIKPEATPPHPCGSCPVYYNQFAMCKTFTLLGFCIKYYFYVSG